MGLFLACYFSFNFGFFCSPAPRPVCQPCPPPVVEQEPCPPPVVERCIPKPSLRFFKCFPRPCHKDIIIEEKVIKEKPAPKKEYDAEEELELAPEA